MPPRRVLNRLKPSEDNMKRTTFKLTTPAVKEAARGKTLDE
jgi:hypothetical protein